MNGPVVIGLLVAMGLVATIYLSADERSIWPGVAVACVGAVGIFALDLPWLQTLLILVTIGAGWAIWRGVGTAIFDVALESAGRPKRSRLGPDWRERLGGDWWADRWSRVRRSSDWPGDADDEVPPAPRAATRGEAEAFRTLGLVEGASAQEIKRAHRRMMKRHHPDRGGSTEAATRLNRAREQLLQG